MKTWITFASAGALTLTACATTPTKPATPQNESPAPAPAKAEPGQALSHEKVQLHFGWTASDSATVTEDRARVIEAMDKKRETHSQLTWHMDVAKAEGGLAIHESELKVEGDPQTAALAPLISKIGEQVALVINPEGAAVRLDGAEKVSSALEEWVSKNIPADKQTPALMNVLKARFSPQALQAEAVDTWTKMVAFWVGEVPLNTGFEGEGMEFEIGDRKPCVERGKLDCVQVAVHVPANDAQKKAAQQQLAPMIQGIAPGAAMELTEVGETVSVLTEIATLKPHRFVRLKEIKGKVTVDGKEQEVKVTDTAVREVGWR